jgi:hypothetical protein
MKKFPVEWHEKLDFDKIFDWLWLLWLVLKSCIEPKYFKIKIHSVPIGKRITLYNCVFFSYEKLSPP